MMLNVPFVNAGFVKHYGVQIDWPSYIINKRSSPVAHLIDITNGPQCEGRIEILNIPSLYRAGYIILEPYTTYEVIARVCYHEQLQNHLSSMHNFKEQNK